MSGIAQLASAEHVDFDKYQVAYDKDAKFYVEEMENKVINAPLEERIEWIQAHQEGKISEWRIDGIFHVKGPSDQERQRQQSLWNQRTVLCLRLQKAFFFGGIGGLLNAGRGAIQLSGFLMIAGGIATIAFSVLSIHSHLQAVRAQQTAQAWRTSPPHRIAEMRTAAYKGAATNEKFLHPQEIQAIYSKQGQKLCKQLLDQNPSTEEEKRRWIEQFAKFDLKNLPRTSKSISDLLLLQREHLMFSSSLFRAQTSKNLEEATQNLINNLNTQRAEAIRDILEKQASSPSEQFQQIDTQIHQEFDQKIEEAKKRHREHQYLIAHQFTDLYYKAAREFLTRLEKAYQGEPYQPMDMAQFFPWLAQHHPQESYSKGR